MATKSKTVEEDLPLLGRFTTQLKIGIVGLPNVGKSSFFNTLTKSSVPAENYPFCTIDPCKSRVAVPDPRFDYLVEHFKPNSSVPAFLNVVDIAGLVAGASEGQGLGNAFLSHIKECDAIFHMIRAFDDVSVTHVNDDVDPIRDIEIIRDELRLKDMDYVKTRLEQMDRSITRANDRSKLYQVVN
ncbi:Obg-like ATPase 1 [Thelohanellus kitauei]|uniref:Obg-like ATPase 1 n=1 Tax=Thelohanellus kitauei TaxID=669202 RepID=A0A0C2MAR2_THEKT|nr:Obg-like ATPase 1 [Thelohanellus kitauei]